ERRQIDSLLNMNFAIFITLNYTCIFQVDQMLHLKRAQLIQYLIGRVNSVKPIGRTAGCAQDHDMAGASRSPSNVVPPTPSITKSAPCPFVIRLVSATKSCSV